MYWCVRRRLNGAAALTYRKPANTAHEQHPTHAQYTHRIILAAFEVLNSIPLISYVPFYAEAKLLFLLLLQVPSVNLARVIFDTWLEPFLAEHEEAIDQTLDEHMKRATALGGDLVKAGVSFARQKVSGVVAAEVQQQIAGEGNASAASKSSKKDS